MAAGSMEQLLRRSKARAAARANYPGEFLKEHVSPVLIRDTYEPDGQALDQVITSEEQFWGRNTDLISVVRMPNFVLSDWFPRLPGLYWSSAALQTRELTELEPQEVDDKLGRFVTPNLKMRLIEMGGIGSIRLRPRMIGSDYCWLGTALTQEFCHAGIPIAIPEQLLQTTGIRWGEKVSLTGRIRFLKDVALEEISSSISGTKPIIVLIDEIKRTNLLRWKSNVIAAPVVLFETQENGRSYTHYTFVHCDTSKNENFDEAADWMQRYAEKYKGRILTNFDQQTERLADAPLSYQRLINKTYEKSTLMDHVGHFNGQILIERLDRMEVTVGHQINVGGNAIVNIDSTLSNVTQSISSATGLDSGQKAQLDNLVKTLTADLEPLKASHPEESQAIATALQSATAQASKPAEQRNKSMLSISADGLISAAKTVSEIAPTVLSTANLIAKFVVGL